MSVGTRLDFFKMSGSGNDFVVVDGRIPGSSAVIRPSTVRRICERRTGVGADGVVLLAPEAGAAFHMIYMNADGSRASMCGNAALCSTRLAVELGLAHGAGMAFETDSGRINARLVDGVPEIDLAPIRDVDVDLSLGFEAGERRMGYAMAGVPHLVVQCVDVEQVDVDRRGGRLRRHEAFAEGANVDFISTGGAERAADTSGEGAVSHETEEHVDAPVWAMRTYERGVEAETLACGTGAVSSALMLRLWGESGDETWIRTRSGRLVRVRLRRVADAWYPSLAGEGRVVFQGSLRELPP